MLLYLYSEADETFMQMNISKRLIGDFALYSVNFLRNFYNELNSCNLQMAIAPTVGFPFTTAYRSRPSFRLTTYRNLVVSVEIPHAPPDQLHGYIQFKITADRISQVAVILGLLEGARLKTPRSCSGLDDIRSISSPRKQYI